MKINRVRLLLPIIWMIIIFSFSCQPGKTSSDTSLEVGMFIGDVFYPGFEQLETADQEQFAQNIQLVVRKTAHVMEYTILMWCFLFAFKGNKVWYALAFTVAYACTDEFHQLFVSGREGKLLDVIIDSSGALLGLLLFYIIKSIYIKISCQHKD